MTFQTAFLGLAILVATPYSAQAASNGNLSFFWSIEPCQVGESKDCCEKKKARKACTDANCRGLNSNECDVACGGTWEEAVGQYCKNVDGPM